MVKLKRIHGHMMSIGGSFWDLGAGSGKLVIAAAMMHNFEVGSINATACLFMYRSETSLQHEMFA